jgi:hypothetical protein
MGSGCPRFDHPAVGMVYHSNDLSQDRIAGLIKFGEDFLPEIAMPKRDLV